MNIVNGYIYILTNHRIPGLVKIGFTTNEVYERISTINSGTGVPNKFKEFCSFPVSNPQRTESIIHNKLKPFRLTMNKEFFELGPNLAKHYVKQIINEAEFGIDLDPTKMILFSEMAHLGKLIRIHRQKKKLRQSDIARLSGTCLKLIVEIEQGKQTAQIGKVLTVLAVLGVNIAIDLPNKGKVSGR